VQRAQTRLACAIELGDFTTTLVEQQASDAWQPPPQQFPIDPGTDLPGSAKSGSMSDMGIFHQLTK
jgi:hypothetical protein